tara:strand:+ start:386 stop:655 length:270 start_codon:yes stop_codon:yes gene_type:complete
MAKLIFRYTEEDFVNEIREAKSIELDVPGDMNIHEFKVVCIRLAASMGYGEKSITKGFGDLIYGEEDKHNLKDLLDELGIKKNSKRTNK